MKRATGLQFAVERECFEDGEQRNNQPASQAIWRRLVVKSTRAPPLPALDENESGIEPMPSVISCNCRCCVCVIFDLVDLWILQLRGYKVWFTLTGCILYTSKTISLIQLSSVLSCNKHILWNFSRIQSISTTRELWIVLSHLKATFRKHQTKNQR